MDSNALEQTITSRTIHIGRCVVYSVVIAGDGANADCQVFDGQSSGSPEKLHLEALSGTSHQWESDRGVLFNHGIYAQVNAVTTHVSVEYLPLPY